MTRQFNFISEKQFVEDFYSEFPNQYSDYIYGNLTLPQRATTWSSGYDFFSPIDFILLPGEVIKIPTGIQVVMPAKEFLMIVPRSGQGFKYFLRLANTVGIIDADYCQAKNEGHIFVKLRNESLDKKLEVKAGEAIAQGIFLEYKTVDGDTFLEGNQRVGGIGSTS